MTISPRLADHPTVRNVRSRQQARPQAVIDADWLRELCLAAGADDVAFADVGNPVLASEAEHAQAALPGARAYISLVVRMNRDNVRSTARSVANQEFHRSGEIVNEVAHRITRALQDAGHRALNPSATFPMEMDRFPGRIWVISHKPVAVASGLGVMGIHRNVIHPRFGNFILLATLVVDTPISSYGADSIGCRNTLTVEVFSSGDERLGREDQRCARGCSSAVACGSGVATADAFARAA